MTDFDFKFGRSHYRGRGLIGLAALVIVVGCMTAFGVLTPWRLIQAYFGYFG